MTEMPNSVLPVRKWFSEVLLRLTDLGNDSGASGYGIPVSIYGPFNGAERPLNIYPIFEPIGAGYNLLQAQALIGMYGGGVGATAGEVLARTATRFVTINAVSVNTETTLWTPTSGKRFRILGGILSVTGASGNLLLRDNTAGAIIAVIPLIVTTPAIHIDYGFYGKLSSTANNLLTAQLTGATLSGELWGTEE